MQPIPTRKAESVKIEQLVREGLQTRVGISAEAVDDYAEALKAKAKLPPAVVFCDGSKYYLADGFHRVEAALRAGHPTIKAEIHKGGFVDALKYALGANAAHGLRRTNADKQRALEIAWENRETLFGGDPTGGALATICAVSRRSGENFVNRMSTAQNVQLTGFKTAHAAADGEPGKADNPPVPRRIGANGKTYAIPVPKRSAPVQARLGTLPVPKHAPGVLVDRFGVEVPTALSGAFTDTSLDEVAQHISAARSLIRRMKDEKNAAYAQLGDSAQIELDNAFREVRFAKPYCVCRMCQGDGCKACGESGFQSETQYRNNPKEYQATEGASK